MGMKKLVFISLFAALVSCSANPNEVSFSPTDLWNIGIYGEYTTDVGAPLYFFGVDSKIVVKEGENVTVQRDGSFVIPAKSSNIQFTLHEAHGHWAVYKYTANGKTYYASLGFGSTMNILISSSYEDSSKPSEPTLGAKLLKKK